MKTDILIYIYIHHSGDERTKEHSVMMTILLSFWAAKVGTFKMRLIDS